MYKGMLHKADFKHHRLLVDLHIHLVALVVELAPEVEEDWGE